MLVKQCANAPIFRKMRGRVVLIGPSQKTVCLQLPTQDLKVWVGRSDLFIFFLRGGGGVIREYTLYILFNIHVIM